MYLSYSLCSETKKMDDSIETVPNVLNCSDTISNNFNIPTSCYRLTVLSHTSVSLLSCNNLEFLSTYT